MVEQNPTLALAIAHRGCVLQDGRIVLSGRAAGRWMTPPMPSSRLPVLRTLGVNDRVRAVLDVVQRG